MAANLDQLKQRLGLPDTPSVRLNEALTHRSYAVENALPYDNQRLEFLGDAVLEIALTEYLFHLYPDADEGTMTKIRSALVRESTLAKLARVLSLGDYLQTGRGEQEAGGSRRESTLADLFEAVLGAVYLDAGFDTARKFVTDLFAEHCPDPYSLLAGINPKGSLQEYSQKQWGATPEYTVLRMTGPEHQPHYEVEVSLHHYTAVGCAASRKNAESEAARHLYQYLIREGVKA